MSRCRRLPLPAPDPDTALQWLRDQNVEPAREWLAAAGGAPLAALRLAQHAETACPPWLTQLIGPLAKGQAPDVGTLAEALEKIAPAEWIDALQRLYTDLMLAAAGAPVRYFPALAAGVAQVAARMNTCLLYTSPSPRDRQKSRMPSSA